MKRDLVLVVDDSDISRAVIKRYLVEAGFRVNEACDGAQGAVAALREIPSVIITDLEMPIMDGFQLARLIKADPATKGVPVVILTSHTEAASRFWGLQTGADAYVTKDDLDDNLVQVVQSLTGRVESTGVVATGELAGPLDVLARVARHLDNGLMEATLTNQILQVGMKRGDLVRACGNLLSLISCLTHAELLAICILDGLKMKIFLHRPTSAPFSLNLADLKNFAAQHCNTSLEELATVAFEGDVRGVGEELSLDHAVTIDFDLHDAVGFIVVWPEEPEHFEGLPRELLVKTAPHASLVIDNVLMAERLWELSTFDGLTGLLNQRSIRERLVEELDRAVRHKAPMAVLLCDVDRFKTVNDTHGHLVGDAVLRELAVRLTRGLRASDVVGRYGGEEFLAILPHADQEAARVVAQRICDDLLEEAMDLPSVGKVLTVTASFGVAGSVEVSGRAVESLIGLADQRMYQAKESGRACVKP